MLFNLGAQNYIFPDTKQINLYHNNSNFVTGIIKQQIYSLDLVPCFRNIWKEFN